MADKLTNTMLGEVVLRSAARLVELLGVRDPNLTALILEEQAVLAAYAALALPDDPLWLKQARLGVLDAPMLLSGPRTLCAGMNCQPGGPGAAAVTTLVAAARGE